MPRVGSSRVLTSLLLCAVGMSLAMISFAADPTSWMIVSSPNSVSTLDNQLNAVTCASASDCWSVGYRDIFSLFNRPPPGPLPPVELHPTLPQTLIQRWNGIGWSIVPSPNATTTTKRQQRKKKQRRRQNQPPQANVLNSVTCTSASNCWAVGSHNNNNSHYAETLIQRWDGFSWTIVPSPGDGVLKSVTCVSPSDCWAVGSSGQTLIEHWDGGSWTIINSPNNNNNGALYSVTCTSASDCWAVGDYNSFQISGSVWVSGPDRALIEHWDGLTWTIVPSPNVPHLAAVTCTSASDCWAVGYYQLGNNVLVGDCAQTLIEKWDGAAWTIIPPETSSPQCGFLEGVTCTSASDCWAVGRYSAYNGGSITPSKVETQIKRWDGSSWVRVESPNLSGPYDHELRGVTCATPADCWAVGKYNNNEDQTQTSHTLTEHYLVPSPVQY